MIRSLYFNCAAAKTQRMSVVITVCGVPDEVRDELAARAARAGKSLQQYVREMLLEAAANPAVWDGVVRADVSGGRIDAETILAARDADRL